MNALSPQLRAWTGQLTDRGVPSPEHDARQLVAHVLEVPAAQLILVDEVTAAQAGAIDELVRRRAAREPLQHIVGTAPFMDLELVVGPGVFVPRPETEALADHAIRWLSQVRQPLVRVVELFAGSGAIGFAVACHVPRAQVLAVESSRAALGYAPRNQASLADRLSAQGSTVRFRHGDAASTTAVADLLGVADAVLANPPYIPDDCVPRDLEVRDHDPAEALYGGPDGLTAIRHMLPVAARLLRPGGLLAVEHGDDQGGTVPAVVRATGTGPQGPGRPDFAEVRDHPDLGGRPRFTTAVRASP
jgi:release factor glutamine methyltransferase